MRLNICAFAFTLSMRSAPFGDPSDSSMLSSRCRFLFSSTLSTLHLNATSGPQGSPYIISLFTCGLVTTRYTELYNYSHSTDPSTRIRSLILTRLLGSCIAFSTQCLGSYTIQSSPTLSYYFSRVCALQKLVSASIPEVSEVSQCPFPNVVSL